MISASPSSSSTSSTSTGSGRLTRSVAIGFSAQGKGERGVLGRGVQPDAAAEVLDDLTAHGQADPGAGKGAALVQPLEQPEDPLRVLGVDADAVVGDGEFPVLAVSGRRDHDPR